jgi:hypothetical protein
VSESEKKRLRLRDMLSVTEVPERVQRVKRNKPASLAGDGNGRKSAASWQITFVRTHNLASTPGQSDEPSDVKSFISTTETRCESFHPLQCVCDFLLRLRVEPSIHFKFHLLWSFISLRGVAAFLRERFDHLAA